MNTIKTEGVWMPQSTFDELDIYVKRLEKVVAAARDALATDGELKHRLLFALTELDRAERGGG